MIELTQEELKRILHYDPDTGMFTWIVSPARHIKIGSVAGRVKITKKDGKGYRAITIKRNFCSEHRLAWLYVHGRYPDNQIDHINGDGTDNRLINLREVTANENCRNKRKPKNNKSGMVGVSWSKNNNKWMACIKINGVTKHIGYFDILLDAVAARINANKFYGFHVNHGKDRKI